MRRRMGAYKEANANAGSFFLRTHPLAYETACVMQVRVSAEYRIQIAHAETYAHVCARL